MHEIQALIGSDTATAAIASTWSMAVRRELIPGLFIVPITRALGRQMTGSEVRWPDLENAEETRKLAIHLAWLTDLLRGLQPRGSVALVLTQYFGGAGEQAALFLGEDDTQNEPLVGSGSINRALAQVGVLREEEKERDEFDVVGLGRWRSSEDIVEDANSPPAADG